MKKKKIKRQQETKIKIVLENAKEYVAELQEMKNAKAEFRKEIEQVNLALKEEARLLRRLSSYSEKYKKICIKEGSGLNAETETE